MRIKLVYGKRKIICIFLPISFLKSFDMASFYKVASENTLISLQNKMYFRWPFTNAWCNWLSRNVVYTFIIKYEYNAEDNMKPNVLYHTKLYVNFNKIIFHLMKGSFEILYNTNNVSKSYKQRSCTLVRHDFKHQT